MDKKYYSMNLEDLSDALHIDVSEIKKNIASLKEVLIQDYDSYGDTWDDKYRREVEMLCKGNYIKHDTASFQKAVYLEHATREYEDCEGETPDFDEEEKDKFMQDLYTRRKRQGSLIIPCEEMCALIEEYSRLSNIVSDRLYYTNQIQMCMSFFDQDVMSDERREVNSNLKRISEKPDGEINAYDFKLICDALKYYRSFESFLGYKRPDLTDGYPLENTGKLVEYYESDCAWIRAQITLAEELEARYNSYTKEEEFTPEEITDMTEETGITKTETNGFKAFWEKVKTKVKNFFNKEK